MAGCTETGSELDLAPRPKSANLQSMYLTRVTQMGAKKLDRSGEGNLNSPECFNFLSEVGP